MGTRLRHERFSKTIRPPLFEWCVLFLRKAKIHMVAVLRANENSNVHSLAVQMRPLLECTGQVVLIFHNLISAVRA